MGKNRYKVYVNGTCFGSCFGWYDTRVYKEKCIY